MTPIAQPPSLRTKPLALLRQMEWMRGLRAAVALCASLILSDLAGIPNLDWAGFGGFEAILADTRSAYRTRMSSLATLSLSGPRRQLAVASHLALLPALGCLPLISTKMPVFWRAAATKHR